MPSCRRPCQAAAQHGSIRRSTPTNYHCTVGAAIVSVRTAAAICRRPVEIHRKGLPLRGAVMAQGAMTERCDRSALCGKLVEIAAAPTPLQQSWMENSTRQGARTPGQGRQFKNSSIRHGFAMPPPLKGRLFHCPLSTGAVYGLHTISCIYPYNRQQFLVVFPSFREIIPGK